MITADIPRVRTYKVVPADIDSFQDHKMLSNDHWLHLGIYYTRPFGHSIALVIPTIVELIEVDKKINWKRADYFHFKWYNLECDYHGFCELPIFRPLDTTGHKDTDISKLIEHQDTIAELLQKSESDLPVSFRDHIVVKALREKGFSKIRA